MSGSQIDRYNFDETDMSNSRRSALYSSRAVKGPVLVATTTNITLWGPQTIDGEALIEDDRVLVKDQTDATENGIYYVAAGAWERANDFNRNDDVVQGTAVWVCGGSQSGFWAVSTVGDITFDTTEIEFVYTNPSGTAASEINGGTVQAFVDADYVVGITAAGALLRWTWAALKTALASATQTLTNKRITPRVYSETSNATPTPATDSYDQHDITALAVAAAFAAPTGTPTDGQKLVLRIKDAGVAKGLSYNAIYRAIGLTLPTTTVAGKTTYIGLIYNAADVKWDAVATVTQS